MRRVLLSLFLFLLPAAFGAACDPGGGPGDPDAGPGDPDTGVEPPSLSSIELTPAETLLELALGESDEQAFVVTGHFDDGSTEDLSASASFSHSDPTVGTMSGSTLAIPAHGELFVGTTVITAEVEGMSARAQLTVVAYPRGGPDSELLIVAPALAPDGPSLTEHTFETAVSALDVFINMDTTGSMGGPIGNLQSSLGGTVVPGIRAAVPDSQLGVGAFEDFPISPFGSNPCFTTGQPDQPFELLQQITPIAADITAGVQGLTMGSSPIGCGNDYPESSFEALYQIATGEGLSGPSPTLVPANHTGVGGVGFREGSLPVVVTISDAPSHNPGHPLCAGGVDYDNNPAVLAVAHTLEETTSALHAICARAMAIAVSDFDSCGPYADGLLFAQSTGARILPDAWDHVEGGRPPGCAIGQCCTGLDGAGVAPDAEGLCPLVYRATFSGSGVSTGLADGVALLARYAPFELTTEVLGVGSDTAGAPLTTPLTTASFVSAIRPLSFGEIPLSGASPPVLTESTFQGLIPGTPATFQVEIRNDFVPQGPTARLFRLTLQARMETCVILDQESLLILVPPARLTP